MTDTSSTTRWVSLVTDALTPVRDTRVRVLGRDHPDTLASSKNLRILYLHLNKLTDAHKLMTDTRRRCERMFGHGHPETGACASILQTIGILTSQKMSSHGEGWRVEEAGEAAKSKSGGAGIPASGTFQSCTHAATCYLENAGWFAKWHGARPSTTNQVLLAARCSLQPAGFESPFHWRWR